MRNPIFSGACTALVTPFINGEVNYPMLQILIKRQIDAGIPAIVLCGTTGESSTLTDQEKLQIIKQGKLYAGSGCKIIAGTGSNSTEHAIALSITAQEAGADGLLIVSPYYNKATSTGLIAHYQSIAEKVSIPIILYNVPSRTGVDIPVSVYRELSKLPNIIGVKEASSDIVKIAKIRRECPADFYIWSGNDDQIVPVMALGGQGVISVLSNLYPELVNILTQAALAEDFRSAGSLQIDLLPLIESLFCEVNPIPVKEGMKILGYNCGECRLPLTSMESDNLKKLKQNLL